MTIQITEKPSANELHGSYVKHRLAVMMWSYLIKYTGVINYGFGGPKISDVEFPKVHKDSVTTGLKTIVHQMAAVTTWSNQDYGASLNQLHQPGTSPPPLVICMSPMFASGAIPEPFSTPIHSSLLLSAVE